MHTINCVYSNSINDYLSNSIRWIMSSILPETQLYLPAYSNLCKRTTTSIPYYQTNPHLPVYTNHFTITNTSLLYYRTQMYLLAYRNHLTITSTCLPYYQRHNYTYLPTATTLQQHPPVYHTYYYQRHNCIYLPTATTLQ